MKTNFTHSWNWNWVRLVYWNLHWNWHLFKWQGKYDSAKCSLAFNECVTSVEPTLFTTSYGRGIWIGTLTSNGIFYRMRYLCVCETITWKLQINENWHKKLNNECLILPYLFNDNWSWNGNFYWVWDFFLLFGQSMKNATISNGLQVENSARNYLLVDNLRQCMVVECAL